MKGIFTLIQLVVLFLSINKEYGILKGQSNSENAQTLLTERRFFRLISNDFSSSSRSFSSLLRSPFGYQKNQFTTVAIIVGSGIASYFFIDEPLRDWVQGIHTPFLSDAATLGDYYGMPYTPLTIGSVLYFAGYANNNAELRLTGRAVLESAIYATFFTSVMKIIFSRSRPFLNEGNEKFSWFEFHDSEWSFPSGHSAIAFATSSTLSARIGNTYAGIALYGLALWTAFNRVYDDKHWFSDTMIGAAIGTTIGLAVASFIHSETKPNEPVLFGQSVIMIEPIPIYQFQLRF
ncbi:MAG: phosphatase PAP2 family protein [Chloroherpetonaceae bacterium]|nr:phosphatase PAP2 family protein [Chloroherpetonaceae bacterium]